MPLLLCLHGAGSNQQIFEMQTAKLRACLGKDYEFVYVDAPIASNAGLGMLPIFAGDGPYYSWFSVSEQKREEEIMHIHGLIREAITTIEAGGKAGAKAREVSGIMAFSQGAIVGTMLLLQQQAGTLQWLPKLKYGIFICADYSDALMSCVEPQSGKWGGSESSEQARLNFPSVHLHGTIDPHGRKSRKLIENHFQRSACKVMWFNGSHQCPNAQSDCQKASDLISSLEGLPNGLDEKDMKIIKSRFDNLQGGIAVDSRVQ